MNEDELISRFKELLVKSINKLADKKEKVEMAFSGGLDSSVLAKLLVDLGYDVTGYVTGMKNSKDILQAKKAAREIGLKLKIIELSEKDIDNAIGIQGKIIKKVYDSINLKGKEFNDRLTPNAVPISYNLPLYFVAKNSLRKKIFLSQGPDEMLGGYRKIERMSKDEALKEMRNITENFIKFGARQNIETATYWGKEFIMPYLDENVVSFCLNLPYELRINQSRKYILRKLALKLGIPEDIAMKEKKAAQYGSGIIDCMKRIAKKKGHHVSVIVKEKMLSG